MFAVINDTGIIVVLVAIVLLFGASRIPKLARNLGEAGKEFKSAQDELRAQPAPSTQVPAAPALTAAPETVTMTRDQLDTLLAKTGNPVPADRAAS